MNLIELRAKQSFLTIKKQEYNHHLGRNVDRTYRFYDTKTKILPPTIDYIYNKPWSVQLNPVEHILDLKLNEVPEETKERFKDNIEIQEEVLRVVKKRNEQFNYRCWLIKLTTWKWKSHVIMDITNYYQTNTLVLVHNVKTLWEMVEKFENFTNIKPAQYWGGKKEIWNITIMTKKSFSLDCEKINKFFWLVLIDEAPIWFSKTFWNSLNKYFHDIKWVALYWLSGTPQKNELETADLEKYFGKVIEVKNQKNNWYNIIPDFKLYDYNVPKWLYEYENPAEMRTVISENQERLQAQVSEAKKLFEDRKCLLILTDRKIEVENFYKNKFWWTFVMTGDTSQKKDEESLNSAKKLVEAWKKVVLIWTIQKVWVWVDIPFIDTVFLASAIKFRSTVIQAIGRGLRKHPWKYDVLVGIWNDLPHYRSQKYEKIKTIQTEYWIDPKNIETIKIWKTKNIL